MSLQQNSGPSSVVASTVSSTGFLERGTFVAGVAIGVAPAVAAAGILLDSRLLGIGVTSGLLVMAVLMAALSDL
jgi:hypothetical protein